MSRRTRRLGTLVLTVAAVGYLVWKIELGTTLDVLANTNIAWFALSFAIMVLTVPVLALRWGWLLDAHAIGQQPDRDDPVQRSHGPRQPRERRMKDGPRDSPSRFGDDDPS